MDFSPKIYEFFLFVLKRQNIWYRKEVLKEPPPWTDDTILSTYKFTNIFRETDKVSKYFIKSLYQNTDLSIETVIFNAIIARVFNINNLFSHLPILPPQGFKSLEFENSIDSAIKSGVGIWNDAYTVTQAKFDSNYRADKHAQFCLLFGFISSKIDTLRSDLYRCKTLSDVSRVLTNFKLIGPFLAGEIALDYTYSGHNIVSPEVNEDHDLAVIGPGTYGSLEYIFGDLKTEAHKSNSIFYLREVQEKYFKLVYDSTGLDWNIIRYKNSFNWRKNNSSFISLNNLESNLCEFRKYLNIANGKGRRRYYHP